MNTRLRRWMFKNLNIRFDKGVYQECMWGESNDLIRRKGLVLKCRGTGKINNFNYLVFIILFFVFLFDRVFIALLVVLQR